MPGRPLGQISTASVKKRESSSRKRSTKSNGCQTIEEVDPHEADLLIYDKSLTYT